MPCIADQGVCVREHVSVSGRHGAFGKKVLKLGFYYAAAADAVVPLCVLVARVQIGMQLELLPLSVVLCVTTGMAVGLVPPPPNCLTTLNPLGNTHTTHTIKGS